METELNVLAGVLETCSRKPLTGFRRTGKCSCYPDDPGCHHVCCKVTASFLKFSRERGNDLITPAPEFAFEGLRPGDYWCLCAPRWQEAFEAGCAPQVKLEATHIKALDHCNLEDLRQHAID